MKKNTIEINGVTFKYRKGLRNKHIYYCHLNECYRNPSWQKQRAFNAWYQWYKETSENHFSECFGIYGYNCQYFSLIMQLHHKNHIYRCYVTGQNNYIEEVY